MGPGAVATTPVYPPPTISIRGSYENRGALPKATKLEYGVGTRELLVVPRPLPHRPARGIHALPPSRTPLRLACSDMTSLGLNECWGTFTDTMACYSVVLIQLSVSSPPHLLRLSLKKNVKVKAFRPRFLFWSQANHSALADPLVICDRYACSQDPSDPGSFCGISPQI